MVKQNNKHQQRGSFNMSQQNRQTSTPFASVVSAPKQENVVVATTAADPEHSEDKNDTLDAGTTENTNTNIAIGLTIASVRPEDAKDTAAVPTTSEGTNPVVDNGTIQPAPIVTTPPVMSAKQDDATLLKYLNDHLDRYKEARSKLADQKQNKELSLKLFKSIIDFLIRNPSVELFATVIKFFRTHYGLIDPKYILIGIHSKKEYTDAEQNRFSAMVEIIVRFVSNDKSPLNLQNLEVMIGNDTLMQLIQAYKVSITR